MNGPGSATIVLLLQWTLLLALGWTVHALCRRWHPRWRVMLWRGVLTGAVLLPVIRLLPVPRVSIAEPRIVPFADMFFQPTATAGIRAQESFAPNKAAESAASTAATGLAVATASPVPASSRDESISWTTLMLLGWITGCGWGLLRLIRLQLKLRRLIRQSALACAPVQSLAQRIQRELSIRRNVRVLVSDEIASPFLSGMLKPVILLPRALADELPPTELDALLSHELAHQRRADLAWCVAWRLMRAVCWFHPLVWKIPEVHTLACEEEADRIAAGRVNDRGDYARFLAQMTLRAMRVSPAETELALNASSHIARRLLQLTRPAATAWRARHSVAGFTVAAMLLVCTAGWQFGQNAAPTPAGPIETSTVLVAVQDESGLRVVGARITPTSLRARDEPLRGSSYAWVPERHGPVATATTDAKGQARVTYPIAIVPTERILTGLVSFTVDHPEFAKAWSRDYPIDGTGKPVTLQRGIPIRVTGFVGPNSERARDITPILLGERLSVPADEWQRENDGSLVWRRMSPGKHFLLVSGRLPSGEIGYSDEIVFFGEQRDAHDFSVELKPGVRVAGRLDPKIARPIRNGWVQLSVHSDDANTRQTPVPLLRSFGETGFWWSYRPIAADGSFVFESVPEGELKVIAYGDGFVSANGPEEQRLLPRGITATSRPPGRATRSVPQSFATARPSTSIEVMTEPAATLKVIAKAGGAPVAGVKVYVSPNVIQMPFGSRLFGAGGESSEASFRKLPALSSPTYTAVTDNRGEAVLRDVPAFTSSLGVTDERFEVPLQPPSDPSLAVRRWPAPHRYVEFELSPGQTKHIEVALQPKGREFLGSSR